MKIYMLRNADTGKWYKRAHKWVAQSLASIWTTKNGPITAKSAHEQHKRRYCDRNPIPPTMEIVELTAVTKDDMEIFLEALKVHADGQDILGGYTYAKWLRELAKKYRGYK